MSETTEGLPQQGAANVPPLPAGAQIPAQRTEPSATAPDLAQSGMAFASAIVAVIAFAAAIGAPPMGFVIGFAGLACAIRAFYMINRNQRSGRNLATFGLLASIAAMLFALGHDDSSSSSSAATITSPSAPSYTYSSPSPHSAPAVSAPVVTTPPAPTYPLNSFGSGTYLVGSEVAPGQYVTEGDDYCYWERGKNTDGDFSSIIANGNANGHTTVTIKPSDKAFKVAGNCTFTKR